MSRYGIQTSTWFRIEGDCSIDYQTSGGDAEFTLGGWDHDIQFIASELGLKKLIGAATKALGDLEAADAEPVG